MKGEADLRLLGIALQSAFQLCTGFDGDPLMYDMCVHDRTRRELNVSREQIPALAPIKVEGATMVG